MHVSTTFLKQETNKKWLLATYVPANISAAIPAHAPPTSAIRKPPKYYYYYLFVELLFSEHTTFFNIIINLM